MSSVSIMGIPGSYSHEAASALLGESARFNECSDFSSTAQALLTGVSECAVLPLRNKIVGEITEPMRLIRTSNLKVVAEIKIPIDHKLIGTSTGSIDTIRMVRSHVEAIRQCSRFFQGNPLIRTTGASDTASGVRTVAAMGDETQAAIGSARAAELYGAQILKSKISDDEGNWTVFGLVTVSREDSNA